MPDDDLEVPDEELVRRFRAGDDRAARQLFERHEAHLRGRARRRIAGGLRRKIGETDVVQDAFIAAFESLQRFEDRGPGSFRRWLDQVLDYTANDQLKHHVGAAKRSVRREQSQASGVVTSLPARSRSPSSEAGHAEERAALSSAIAEMDGDDRRILELVHEQGKDFAEAGRAMGRTAEAARKLYGRVVMRLSKRMRPSS